MEPPTDDYAHFGLLAHLTHLTFYAGAMDDTQCRVLSQSLSPTIVALKLSGLAITTSGVSHFAYGFPSLRDFDITFTSARTEELYDVLRDEEAFPVLQNLVVCWPMTAQLRDLFRQSGMDRRARAISTKNIPRL